MRDSCANSSSNHACCEHSTLQSGVQSSLYEYINVEKVWCLNECEPNSVRGVFKPLCRKLELQPFVKSDADEQLILHIPFTGDMKIESICIHGPSQPSYDTYPSHMKAFCNRDDIDFDNVNELACVQEWDLQPDLVGRLEYPTKVSKFQNIHSLTLYFDSNFGSDHTIISYIGFKGDYKPIKRDAIITVYELNANPADHKIQAMDGLKNNSIW